MVMVDGSVSSKEKMELYRIGEEYYGVSPEEFNKLIVSNDILFYTPQTDAEKILFLYDFALIAWADGEVAKEEKSLMYRFALRFGVQEKEVQSLIEFLLDKAKTHMSHEDLMKEFTE